MGYCLDFVGEAHHKLLDFVEFAVDDELAEGDSFDCLEVLLAGLGSEGVGDVVAEVEEGEGGGGGGRERAWGSGLGLGGGLKFGEGVGEFGRGRVEKGWVWEEGGEGFRGGVG